MNFEEFKKYVDETLKSVYSKLNEEEKTFISDLVTKFNQKCEENEGLKDKIDLRNKENQSLKEEIYNLKMKNKRLKVKIKKIIDAINYLDIDEKRVNTIKIILNRELKEQK